MTLPNEHFQDFPIEFKQINPEDFPHFHVEEKIIITPDQHGYINTALQENINLDERNTLVINAGVGQGKTFSIIQIIKQYYESDENYLVFVAAPYTSLVQQYCQKIEETGIPKEQIYSYDYIGVEMHLDAWDSKIQVLTANALLGNPGENDFINSQAKRDYINYLVSKCEENNRKVIFIYDEIHDSYYNFKEEYIFNLWKWRNVIKKNILLSATYNEASKIVIEYLAELTDDNIKIIESERVRFRERQSDLFLHFNPANHYSHTNDLMMNLVQNLIGQGKNIDILSFGKTLADNICNKTDEGLGKILFDAGIELQNCTSDLDDNQRPYREIPQNRYNPNKCNIGTNFKSGVSIEKDNHALIVILPPLGRKGNFKNRFGIFTDGVNSIIQALARQRNSRERVLGEIHVVLPPPDKFNFNTLPFDDEHLILSYIRSYEICQNFRSSESNLVSYHSLNSQDDMLKEYYENIIYAEIDEEQRHINTIERNSNKVRLEFPSYKLFKLDKSEKYFPSKIKFFGKDISAYVTYGAFTNQFVNCNLKGINTKSPLFFHEGEIQYKLDKFIHDYLSIDLLNSFALNVSDKYKYFELKKELFQYKVLYKSSQTNNYEEVTSFSNKDFEQQFLALVQRKFYPLNREFAKRFKRGRLYEDGQYTRGEHFRNCITHAIYLQSLNENSLLIEAYSSLHYFRNKVENSIIQGERANHRINYVLNQPPMNFVNSQENDRFIRMYVILTEHDVLINNGVFDFKRAFSRTTEVSKKIKSLYSYILEDFFKTSPNYIYRDGGQARITEIHGVLDFPNANMVLNMVSEADTNFSEDYWQMESKNDEFESLKKAATNQ